MEKITKSIQIFLFFSVLQLGISSSIFWSGQSLALKQSCLIFLLALLILAGSCTFIQYLLSKDHKPKQLLHKSPHLFLLYGSMIVFNIVGLGLLLSETILTTNSHQQVTLDFLVPSFFFLFGMDLFTFLTFKKRGKIKSLGQQKTISLALIVSSSSLIFLNPITILSIGFYIALGGLSLRLLFPQKLRQGISFYSHIIRNILFVVFILLIW